MNSKSLKSIFTQTRFLPNLNSTNSFYSAIFENQSICFQYAVSGKGDKPFLFFTGFGENPLIYNRFLKHLPSDYFLIVVKCPIEFKNNAAELEEAIIELLQLHKLPLNICIGGFSFGNWVALSLLFSKKITIKAVVALAAPSSLNYRFYQILNQNKALNFIAKQFVKSSFLNFLLKAMATIFMYLKIVQFPHFIMSKKFNFRQDLFYYLNSPFSKESLSSILIQTNSLAIPFLALKSNQDPVTRSDSFYNQAQKHIQNLVLKSVDSNQHSAFIEEFMKEFGSFLAAV